MHARQPGGGEGGGWGGGGEDGWWWFGLSSVPFPLEQHMTMGQVVGQWDRDSCLGRTSCRGAGQAVSHLHNEGINEAGQHNPSCLQKRFLQE